VLDLCPCPPRQGGGGSTFDAAFAKLLWPLVLCNLVMAKASIRHVGKCVC